MRGLVGLGDLGDEDEFFFLHSVQSQFSLGIDFNDGDTQLRWHVLLHESQHSKSRKERGKANEKNQVRFIETVDQIISNRRQSQIL